MSDSPLVVVQGTLELLVLKTLAASAPAHGFGILEFIKKATDARLLIEEGALYPALHRMEQEGLLKPEGGTRDTNRPARFYTWPAAGRRQLALEQEQWDRLTEGVRRVLRYA